MGSEYSDDLMRAKALFKSGEDKFSALFATLDDVRRRMGDDNQFARWCFDDLHVPVSVLVRITDVLTIVDAKLAKEKLARAKEAERVIRAQKKTATKGEPTAQERDLAAQVAELQGKLAETQQSLAEALATSPVKNGADGPQMHKPHRDRRDYMREFMRRKRAAARA